MAINSKIKDLIELLRKGENYEIEFKESVNGLSKSFWETYSAFANTAGGYIILGVSEKENAIVGVNAPDKIKRDLFSLANNRDKVSHSILDDTDVTEYKIDGKIIIAIHIKELPINQKPLYLKGNPLFSYIRKNDSDCKITQEDYRRFVRNSTSDFDGELLDNYFLEDLNLNSVLSFKNIMSIREPDKQFMSMDNLKFLTDIGIFRIDRTDNRKLKLTLAGLLFLGKTDAITQKIPHFHLEYINKRGSTERWRDRVSTGDINYPDLNLFEFYRIVREKLRLTVEDKFELDKKSIRKPPSELDKALREALTNMIIHADYLDSDTSIKVTAENLFYIFLNPGSMKISSEQFFTGGFSNPRNYTLFQYFRRMGESEQAGTGGKEIINVISKNKYRFPDLKTDYKHTELKLWTAIPSETYEDLSDDSRLVLKYADSKEQPITRNDIKKHTGLSDYYIRKAIKELSDKKLLLCRGKGRATVYYKAKSIVETFNMVNQLTDKLKSIISPV